jgi:hypothetical protein
MFKINTNCPLILTVQRITQQPLLLQPVVIIGQLYMLMMTIIKQPCPVLLKKLMIEAFCFTFVSLPMAWMSQCAVDPLFLSILTCLMGVPT